MSEEREKYLLTDLGKESQARTQHEQRIQAAKAELQEIQDRLNTINSAASVMSLAEGGEQPSGSYKLILSSIGLITQNLIRLEELLDGLRQ